MTKDDRRDDPRTAAVHKNGGTHHDHVVVEIQEWNDDDDDNHDSMVPIRSPTTISPSEHVLHTPRHDDHNDVDDPMEPMMVTATTTTPPPTTWTPNSSSSSSSNCSNTSNHHNLGGTITTPMTTHAHFLVVPWTVSTWPTRPSVFLPTEATALLSDRTDVHRPPQRPRSKSVGSSYTTGNTRNSNITIPTSTTPFSSSLYVPSLFSSMTVSNPTHPTTMTSLDHHHHHQQHPLVLQPCGCQPTTTTTPTLHRNSITSDNDSIHHENHHHLPPTTMTEQPTLNEPHDRLDTTNTTTTTSTTNQPAHTNHNNSILIGILYGMIHATIVIPVILSFGTIIYRHPIFVPYMTTLIHLTLVSSMVHQITFSICSTLPFAIGQVQDAGLIFLSNMATTIVQYYQQQQQQQQYDDIQTTSTMTTTMTVVSDSIHPDVNMDISKHPDIMIRLLATTTVALSLSTVVLGMALVAIGHFRWAQYVQLLPPW
jgi:hypothetical protein